MTQPSTTIFGGNRADEQALRDALGGDAHGFFTLAQRVAWGLTQPDLIRTDVPAAVRRLLDGYGAAFPAHLLAAWSERDRDRAQADRHLARAHELAAGSPLAWLLPEDDDWQAVRPEQRLFEVVPDQVWRVQHRFEQTGTGLLSSSTATVVRVESGELAILNAVGLDEPVAAEIDALGTVRWVCAQGKSHSRFLMGLAQRFPGARTIGTRGHLEHGPADHLVLDGLLEVPGALPRELHPLPIEGTVLGEVFVLHEPTGTLVTHDFLANNRADAPIEIGGRLYYFSFGLVDRIGLLSYAPVMWTDPGALRASLRQVLASGFRQVVGAHWPEAAVSDDARGQAERAFAGILDRTDRELMWHRARYFWSQPGFLRDLLRYKITTKPGAGATCRDQAHAPPMTERKVGSA